MSAPVRAQIGADATTRDLWRLAETEDTEQLERILERGADINASNGEGVTALMRAAYNGRVKMVRALIDHGAELNATRADGFTPLVLAAFFGHVDVVRVLVEHGADLSTSTRFATSAQMWARARCFHEVAQYLEQARSSKHEFGAQPSPLPNQPGEVIAVAEPDSAEPATTADSDLTLESPRVAFADQSISEDIEENPVANQEDKRPLAEPLIVRTLKDPPQISDLVHERPGQLSPAAAFVPRLTSNNTNLFVMTVAVLFISGLCTFAVLTIREARKPNTAVARVREEGASQIIPLSTVTAAGTEQNARHTPTTSIERQPDNPASAIKISTHSIPHTGVSVHSIPKRAALAAAPAAALSGNKRVVVASSGQNPKSKPPPARSDSETAPDAGTRARFQTPQIGGLKERSEKGLSQSAPARNRSNTTLSPQLIGTPTTSSAPKAKVIQWP